MKRVAWLFVVVGLFIGLIGCGREGLPVAPEDQSEQSGIDLPGDVVAVDEYLQIMYLPKYKSIVLNGPDAWRFPILVLIPPANSDLPVLRIEYIFEDNAGFKLGGIDLLYRYVLLQDKNGNWLMSTDSKIALINVGLVNQPWGWGTDMWFYIDRGTITEPPITPLPPVDGKSHFDLINGKLILVGDLFRPHSSAVAIFWATLEIAERDGLPSVQVEYDGTGWPVPANTAYQYFTLYKDGQRVWLDLGLVEDSATVIVGVDPNNPPSGALIIIR